jgi:glycosyltransferase involved in cell wall biosynthesis
MCVVSDIRTDARVQREANALAEAGHEVRVIAFDYSLRRRETRVMAGVKYELFPFPGRDIAKPLRIIGIVASLTRVALHVGSTSADVFHCHNLHLALPAAVAARRKRAYFVFDAHEMEDTRHRGLARWAVHRFQRTIWRRSDLTITTNASRATYFEKAYKSRPLVINNFPSRPHALRPANLRGDLKIPETARLLIFQGGFYMESRCFAQVAHALRSRKQWHWIFVGFGSDIALSRLNEILDAAGIGPRCHVLPPVAVDRLLDFTAACDVGVVPLNNLNLNNYLGDTNKLFEYLAAGLAVVGSDFPEVRRAVLENGVGPVGAVFNPLDPHSIGEALDRVEAELPEMRANAAAVRAQFSWEDESRVLVDAYVTLASQPPMIHRHSKG